MKPLIIYILAVPIFLWFLGMFALYISSLF
jgi:hypothetical protein